MSRCRSSCYLFGMQKQELLANDRCRLSRDDESDAGFILTYDGYVKNNDLMMIRSLLGICKTW